jgi:C1A family cysteine protease
MLRKKPRFSDQELTGPGGHSEHKEADMKNQTDHAAHAAQKPSSHTQEVRMKKSNLKYTLVPLLAAFLMACGTPSGQPQTQPQNDPFFEAKNTFGSEAPLGAAIVSSEEFKKVFSEQNAKFFTKADLEKIRVDEEKRNSENEAVVQNYVKAFPEAANLLLETDEEKINGDGDQLQKIAEGQSVIKLGRRSRIAALASNITVFPSQSNQLGLYESGLSNLRAFLDEKLNKNYSFEQLGLATLEEAKKMSAETLLAQNSQLLEVANEYGIRDYARLALYDPEDPKNEKGAANQLDRNQTGACEAPSSGGIYSNFNWPLKKFTSSVKQQGNRGTCWGFADVAALEIVVAKKLNRRVNFSEQDLAANRFLYLQPRDSGDGGDAFGLAHTAWKQGFEFAYEKEWEYNKSWSQMNVEAPAKSNKWHLEKTCVGYSDLCSNTNYQGHLVCVNIPILGYQCFKASKNILSRSGYTFGNEPRDFWQADETQRSALTLALRSLFGGATVLGIDANYMQPDANGFVANLEPTFLKGVKQVGLNHYVTVTGYITNETLRQKLPNAPSGAGGGYFILKNSWGDCWGDAGYAYVPWDWVKKFSGQAIQID